jgi:hypothetical protein
MHPPEKSHGIEGTGKKARKMSQVCWKKGTASTGKKAWKRKALPLELEEKARLACRPIIIDLPPESRFGPNHGMAQPPPLADMRVPQF